MDLLLYYFIFTLKYDSITQKIEKKLITCKFGLENDFLYNIINYIVQ